jgi:hypothetical protein
VANVISATFPYGFAMDNNRGLPSRYSTLAGAISRFRSAAELQYDVSTHHTNRGTPTTSIAKISARRRTAMLDDRLPRK